MSLDASFYHRLTNKFQGPGQSLDVKPDGSRHLKMAATGDYSGQYWRLVDLGRGRYALRTQYLGDCFSLDVINDGRNETPWLNETGNYSGQFWSLTPWGDGTYKLTNDFTGPGKSLNVYAGSFEPFVGAGDHSGQHWVLTPLRRIAPNASVPDLDPRGNPSHNEGPSDHGFYPRPLGTIRAVMVFVDFPDVPAGSRTTQQAAQQILGADNAAQRLYHDQSYGKLTLEVDVKSNLGWKRMSQPSSAHDFSTADRHRTYITDAARLFSRQLSPEVIFGAYHFVFIAAPPTPHLPKSPAFNQAVGNGAPSLTGEIRFAVTLGKDIYDYRYVTLVHEVGHLFDLPDLYPGDGGAENLKAGCWDIMSDTFRASSFLGWHRHKNGWLDPARMLYISQSAPAWYTTLSPLSGGCGTSMVVLPVDDAARPSKVFVIELAPPVLGLGNRPRTARGVLVYTVDATIPDQQCPLVIVPKVVSTDREYGALYEAAYDVGDRCSVAIGRASLEVSVLQKVGACYNVRIDYARH